MQISNSQAYYKKDITDKIINYGLKFIALMSIPLNIITYFAIIESRYLLIKILPVFFSVFTFIIFFLRNKITINTKLWIFTILMFFVGIYTLLLGLLDMASLWFVVSIIFALFNKTKNLSLFVFIFALSLIIGTGLLMFLKNPYLPIDYGFDKCQFACVSIRIINFLIIGFLIFKILNMFFSTIELYIHEIIDKNIVLQQLKATEKNEAEQKLKNQILKNNLEKHELELDYKRKELADAFSKIMQFNILLNNLKKDITNQNYKEAILNLTVNQSKYYNFENFIVKFAELYPDFIIKLKDTYPHLTETDVKLCILIASGLKSGEIGELLNVAETSVGKYRNRIRKKLSLENNADIALYLFDKLNFHKINSL